MAGPNAVLGPACRVGVIAEHHLVAKMFCDTLGEGELNETGNIGRVVHAFKLFLLGADKSFKGDLVYTLVVLQLQFAVL